MGLGLAPVIWSWEQDHGSTQQGAVCRLQRWNPGPPGRGWGGWSLHQLAATRSGTLGRPGRSQVCYIGQSELGSRPLLSLQGTESLLCPAPTRGGTPGRVPVECQSIKAKGEILCFLGGRHTGWWGGLPHWLARPGTLDPPGGNHTWWLEWVWVGFCAFPVGGGVTALTDWSRGWDPRTSWHSHCVGMSHGWAGPLPRGRQSHPAI